MEPVLALIVFGLALWWLARQIGKPPAGSSTPATLRVTVSADDSEHPERLTAPLVDRIVEPPSDGIWLRPGRSGVVQVVGEASYQEAIARVVGRRQPDGVDMKVTAALVHEPDNRHDRNAVSVRIDGTVVGYLARADAQVYEPVARRLRELGRTGYCQARVRGGWDRGRGDTGYFGVTLRLGEPESQMKLLDEIEKRDQRAAR